MDSLHIARQPPRENINYTSSPAAFTGGSDPLSSWIRENHAVNHQFDSVMRQEALGFVRLNERITESWTDWRHTDTVGADKVSATVREV